MQRTQNIRLFSSKKIQMQKNLPSLKSSVLMNKAMIAISKVDINCKPIQKQKKLRTTLNAHEVDTHQRSQSGFSMRKNKELQANIDNKSQTKMQFDLPSNSFKMQLKNIRQQIQSQNTMQPFIIDKSKVSSKPYGIIKGYSANSHPGPLLSYNEDRICIITNLTKTNVKEKQISFFGVYDGNQGTTKADYFRDNFHIFLMEEQIFPRDIQMAMKRTLRKIVNNFNDDPKLNGDESSVSFALIVAFNEDVFYMQSGYCKSAISQRLGQNIFNPSKSEPVVMREQSKKSKSAAELIKKNSKNLRQILEIEFKHLKAHDSLDFILLGSEGVFQNMKIKDIGKKIWLYLLRNRYETIHFALGQANNLLINDIFANLGTKNASIIIIGFSSLGGCFETIQDEDFIELPYVKSKATNDN